VTTAAVPTAAPAERSPGLARRYLLGWGAACQLVGDLLLATVYLGVIAGAVAGVGLVLAFGIGLLVLAVVGIVAFGLSYFERARLAAFTGIDVPAPPGPPPTANALTRLVLNARPWKSLLYLLLISLWGLVAGTTMLSGLGAGLALTLLPLYAGQLPDGRIDLPFNSWLPAADASWLWIVGAALLLLIVPLVATLLVKVDVALVRGLLGAGDRERVAQLSERVVTLTETRERAVDSVELERRRIERDLHDGPQQRLVSIAMDLGMARERLDRDPSGARELLDKAHTSAKEAIIEMRQVARGIHPPVLTDRGLDAALSALAARSPEPVQVAVNLTARPSPTTEAIAYFCVSEALTNVAKHSRASQARVDVSAEQGWLVVHVWDNGQGGARPGAGTGLLGLQDRVAAVDGRLWVESPAGGPTLLTIQLPWTPSRAGNPYAAPAHIQPNQPVQNNQPDQNSQEAAR
jgi:signal transduction histidine kinase